MLIASQSLESQQLPSNPRQFNYRSTCSQSTACRQRKPPALQVVSSYSSFVPNQVFDKCRPFEVLTYAAVQYLSFHSIKCSTRNIGKNVNLSVSAIKKALCSLRKQRFIEKQGDGTCLFRNLKIEGSVELVDAKEVVSLHLGYWFPVDVLKSKRISNQEKRVLSVILSLIKTGANKIEMTYLAEKLNLSREKTSPLVGRLLTERLVSRHRNHCRSVYFYQIGEKAMSIYKKDLPTGYKGNRINSDRYHKKGVPDVTSKGVPDVTSFSIKESNLFIRDKRTEREPVDSDKNGENKSISFWKEEERRLNVQYTKACNDEDWERMREIGSELSMIEREVM